MSFKDFLKWLAGRKPPKPPVVTQKYVLVEVRVGGQPIQGASIAGRLTTSTWSVEGVPASWWQLTFKLPKGVDHGIPAMLDVTATGYEDYHAEQVLAPVVAVEPTPIVPPAPV